MTPEVAEFIQMINQALLADDFAALLAEIDRLRSSLDMVARRWERVDLSSVNRDYLEQLAWAMRHDARGVRAWAKQSTIGLTRKCGMLQTLRSGERHSACADSACADSELR
jgi:hypothetical protein